MQHVSDSWRTTIGSMAITIINSICENSDDNFLTDNKRQVFAKEQLEGLYFLYGEMQSKVWKVLYF